MNPPKQRVYPKLFRGDLFEVQQAFRHTTDKIYQLQSVVDGLEEAVGLFRSKILNQDNTSTSTGDAPVSGSGGENEPTELTVIVDYQINRKLYSATDYVVGTFFCTYDTMMIYQCRIFHARHEWLWIAGGPHRGLIANIPTDLGDTDEGYTYYATDFDHTFYWNGTGWEWGPGETKPGALIHHDSDPGTGWHVCDGTMGVSRSQIVAGVVGTVPVNVPDMSLGGVGHYLKHGAYTGTPHVAIAATIDGETADEAVPRHTHPAGTYAAATFVGGGSSGPDAATLTDSHGHTITGDSGEATAHKHAKGTLHNELDGEPPYLTALLYMRL